MFATQLLAALLLSCYIVALAKEPEETMNAPQIIKHHGYPVEEYKATTKDKYILQLYRIPHGRNDQKKDGKPVVYFQHGLLCSSVDWILNFPAQSAPFIFADNGFDVWLGNFRGCEYSKEHETLKTTEEKFWEFTWSDMAQYDLQAIIEKVIEVSKQAKVYYVGHSQGTMTIFAKLSEDQEFAKKIHHVFALGPVSTVKHIRGPLQYLAMGGDKIKDLLLSIGRHEFLPQKHFSDFFVNNLCRLWFVSSLCANFMFQIFGPDSQQFNKTRLPVYLAHTPSGTSTLNVAHFAQMRNSGKFEKFNFGSEKKNRQRYNQSEPPEYDVSRIKVGISLYWGSNDWLATPKDITDNLIPKLNKGNTLIENVKLENFNHIDFLWGSEAPEKVFKPILEKIRKIQGS